MGDFYEEDEDLADVLAAFERGVKRLTEPIRREIANRHRGEVVEGSGRAMRAKRLAVVQSVRFTHEEATELRATVERMGLRGLSDLLRGAARAAIQPVGFRCEHANVTCGPGFTSFTGNCGCEMEPIYRDLVTQ